MSGPLRHWDQQMPQPEAAAFDPADTLPRSGASSRSFKSVSPGYGTTVPGKAVGEASECGGDEVGRFVAVSSSLSSLFRTSLPGFLGCTVCGRSVQSTVPLSYISRPDFSNVRFAAASASLPSLFRTSLPRFLGCTFCCRSALSTVPISYTSRWGTQGMVFCTSTGRKRSHRAMSYLTTSRRTSPSARKEIFSAERSV